MNEEFETGLAKSFEALGETEKKIFALFEEMVNLVINFALLHSEDSIDVLALREREENP